MRGETVGETGLRFHLKPLGRFFLPEEGAGRAPALVPACVGISRVVGGALPRLFAGMSLKSLVRLASSLAVPDDYFKGLRAPAPVRADNILLFFRAGFASLQQRSLENLSHHRFVLFIALEGGAGVNLDQAEHPLRAGHALLAFPYQFHFFLHPEGACLSWLILTFESDEPASLEPLRERPVPIDAGAYARLEALLTAYMAARPGTEPETRLQAELFLQGLADAARRPSPVGVGGESGPAGRESAGWLAHINRRLHAGGAAGFKITTLAQEIGVSERLLRLRFLENFGVSLGAYVHNFQLNRAAGLLTQSALPLGEIAGRCGYTSQAAFSRAFRARTGVAPKEYRAKRREPLPDEAGAQSGPTGAVVSGGM